ncbi:KUP/HAK/KT family potassium transporter [Gemmobacter lanyuensis]
MRESLHAAAHDGLTRDDVLGVISLLVWTLTLIVSLKYVLLIMRADNNGEGGTLSLIALVQRALTRRPAWLIGIGAVGISLFFGDSIITPAMSVLSAVEGSVLRPRSAWLRRADHPRDHHRAFRHAIARDRGGIGPFRPDHGGLVPCHGGAGPHPYQR